MEEEPSITKTIDFVSLYLLREFPVPSLESEPFPGASKLPLGYYCDDDDDDSLSILLLELVVVDAVEDAVPEN